LLAIARFLLGFRVDCDQGAVIVCYILEHGVFEILFRFKREDWYCDAVEDKKHWIGVISFHKLNGFFNSGADGSASKRLKKAVGVILLIARRFCITFS
jgi:hypothetical protein